MMSDQQVIYICLTYITVFILDREDTQCIVLSRVLGTRNRDLVRPAPATRGRATGMISEIWYT